jgi:hypothetical protein
MASVTSEETGTVRDNPWLVGSYARNDVDQEHAVVIAFSRRLETLAAYNSRHGVESLWDPLGFSHHLMTIHSVYRFGFETELGMFECESDADIEA